MGEYATIRAFMSRDKDNEPTEVIGRFPGGRTFGNIFSKESIRRYESLWTERYSLKNEYFDGYGWYTDLEGEFPSKEAAEAAFSNLKNGIAKMDAATQNPEINDREGRCQDGAA